MYTQHTRIADGTHQTSTRPPFAFTNLSYFMTEVVSWHSRFQCKVWPCGETLIHIGIWCKLLASQMLKGPRCKTGTVDRAVHNLSAWHSNKPQVSGFMGPVVSLRSTWLESDSQYTLSHSHGGANAQMTIAFVCVCVCVCV